MTLPLKSAAPAERPRLLVVAGPNGSGKTSVTEQGLRHEWFRDCLYINPDNLARDRFGDWNAPASILQAARLADTMREDALMAGISLAFETVLSTEAKLDYLRRAKSAGYFIRLFFVGTASPTGLAELAASQLDPDLLRLCIGTEPPEEIIAGLAEALG